MPDSPTELTVVLQAASEGDPKAASELLPLVYSELRKLAQARMAKTPPGNTLQPTALVHEAYLRLIGSDADDWNSRGHFFAAAAQAMRQILVEQARRKASLKAGGGYKRVDLSGFDAGIEVDLPAEDLLALDEAVARLERLDPRKGKLVVMRYFSGMTNQEAAAALDVSVPTVENDWRFIRAFLYDQLCPRDGDE